jgi:outer membrane protein assembly factor BamB
LLGDQYEANHTILYVPTGNQLSVFDTTSATEHTALTRLYGIRTRGDVVGRLARTTVAGRAAILATDTSGLVLAVDADPAAPENRRAIGSWALDGTCIGGPVCSATPPVAYVAVAEGRVTAIDLARPGQLLWRFPAQGAIAAQIPGAPTIGIRGIYFADGNGTLHCLDAQTGAERWKTDLGSPVTTGILAHEGRIYIPTHGGSLICLEEGED